MSDCLTESVCYREIDSFPGYRVGDDGTVWTRRRKGPGNYLNPTWKPMTLKIDRYGYPVVGLRRNDGRKHFFTVHSLVLTAFVGPRPEGMEACHYPDAARTNCRLDNLRWDTQMENHADKRRHGTIARGEKAGLSKLTEQQVLEIRRRFSAGEFQKDLAKEYGVVQSLVSAIVLRKIWSHI